ncbi:MAG TPA: hypothetical protein ENG63_02960 [Candidatus Desulfofervidus auxilii]|uniref:CRISPR system Cms protein Csm4 n=1 Tax=Desulfofervidus auxilii TaxID=1621989 RepID=A0A7C0Y200_DESA2|nr:MAG: hypothetical protein DRN73_08730 [Candidatus Pacearchaeota archaeon]HDD43807.1 hypothetical protein [Candidatus Desulfofervidus auxilii]
MKVYEIKIRPLTGFGIPIQGDTLFGHLCWQFYYDSKLLGKTLDYFLEIYTRKPFIIVSSAFPVVDGNVYLVRPALPIHYLTKLSEDEIVEKRKELKKLNYFKLSLPLSSLCEISYKRLEYIKEEEQVRCSIHRLLGTTAKAPFGPYAVKKIWYLTDLVIFIGIRENISIEGVLEALKRIGKFGYGRDASLGWGKFDVLEIKERDFYKNVKSFNAYYTLGPSLPESNEYEKIYFEPFVKFGKHGDKLSISKNPFKAPVLMANTGAIYIPKKPDRRTYLGKAIFGVSSVLETAVTQAYSLVIPVEV